MLTYNIKGKLSLFLEAKACTWYLEGYMYVTRGSVTDNFDKNDDLMMS